MPSGINLTSFCLWRWSVISVSSFMTFPWPIYSATARNIYPVAESPYKQPLILEPFFGLFPPCISLPFPSLFRIWVESWSSVVRLVFLQPLVAWTWGCSLPGLFLGWGWGFFGIMDIARFVFLFDCTLRCVCNLRVGFEGRWVVFRESRVAGENCTHKLVVIKVGVEIYLQEFVHHEWLDVRFINWLLVQELDNFDSWPMKSCSLAAMTILPYSIVLETG